MSLSKFIPLSVPNLTGNELKYINEAVSDGWVSSVGPHVEKFEKEFARYIGARYAVACMNGTAALHISLLLSDVKPGDEVLAPNLTFVAPLNAIRYCFANPVLLDSNWESMGIDITKLRDFINKETIYKTGHTYNKQTGRRIKAIIPMHTLGYPVDMDPLIEICNKANITVIEDATESLGSEYKGKKTGNFGKLACFSFNGNKIITTGGGGMIVTNEEKIAARAKHLTTTAKTDPIEYDHDEVGYNYRLVNVLAAIGIGQLERINEFVEKKRKNISLYKNFIESIEGFYLHTEPNYSNSNYWMYSLIIEKSSSRSVKDIINHFAKNNIQTRPLWRLMNTLPMYKECQSYHCDVSLELYKRVISLPCSTGITLEEIQRVCEVLNQYK